MNPKSEPLTELPPKLQMENALMMWGAVLATMFLPIFLYNCTKTARNKKWVKPVRMTISNPLQGVSTANIIYNALWQYGIPTHIILSQFTLSDGSISLTSEFYVPSTQAFMADVLLRQWSGRIGFLNESAMQYQNGIPSSRYRDKLYKPLGVIAKNKSVDMMIGNLLFGSTLSKANVTYSQKNDSVEFKTQPSDIPKAAKNQRKVAKKSVKLGKTYQK